MPAIHTLQSVGERERESREGDGRLELKLEIPIMGVTSGKLLPKRETDAPRRGAAGLDPGAPTTQTVGYRRADPTLFWSKTYPPAQTRKVEHDLIFGLREAY